MLLSETDFHCAPRSHLFIHFLECLQEKHQTPYSRGKDEQRLGYTHFGQPLLSNGPQFLALMGCGRIRSGFARYDGF